MNLRRYNIYFHTHTISGIIITAALFVIFFAGSFSFFKDEISNWQKNTPNNTVAKQQIDYNLLTDTLSNRYNLHGRDISFYINDRSRKLGVYISESKDTITNKAPGGYYALDVKNFAMQDYDKGYDLGEFLYRLHFFAPLNEAGKFGFPLGYYIAGTVAFIFLFALITGVLVHWQKIVSNFYVFRPWEKLKTVWTDLHTSLGVICFPFLFVFAVTGTYFLISYPLFTQPAVAAHYGGNQDSLFKEMGYGASKVEFKNKPMAGRVDLNNYVQQAKQKWGNVVLREVEMLNYGDSSMQVHVEASAEPSEKMISRGNMVFHIAEGKVTEEKSPDAATTYGDVADNILYTLHFGAYGGFATKVLYFLLGICSCIVIISGVLIWLVAREKSNVPEKKRRFNLWLANIYLAICMSMLPVTAISFITVKIYPAASKAFIYPFYFFTWLGISVLLAIRKDLYKTNRDCMLAGGLIGLLVPIVNGCITGNWPWQSIHYGYHDILLIDLFWLFLSTGALICWRLIIKKHQAKKQPVMMAAAMA